MTHRLEFLATYRLDLQVPKKPRLEQLMMKQGEILEARVRPYVVESQEGPVEVADLDLAHDGTILCVPMGCFRFLDN